MLNTHPINRLSKAGAALVNTISSLEVSIVLSCYPLLFSISCFLVVSIALYLIASSLAHV